MMSQIWKQSRSDYGKLLPVLLEEVSRSGTSGRCVEILTNVDVYSKMRPNLVETIIFWCLFTSFHDEMSSDINLPTRKGVIRSTFIQSYGDNDAKPGPENTTNTSREAGLLWSKSLQPEQNIYNRRDPERQNTQKHVLSSNKPRGGSCSRVRTLQSRRC